MQNVLKLLDHAMKRVNEGLSEQAIEAREARGTLLDLQENSKKLEAEQKKLTSSFKLQNAELGQTLVKLISWN